MVSISVVIIVFVLQKGFFREAHTIPFCQVRQGSYGKTFLQLLAALLQ
jgi:hypothetical protein